MSITHALDKPRDMLAKARREQARLSEALRTQDRTTIADTLFNFAVTADHIKDWLKQSASASYSPSQVERYIEADKCLRLCGEICNASKHQKLKPVANDTRTITFSATGSFVVASIDPNDVKLECDTTPSFKVKVVAFDGSRYEADEFAAHVIQAWEQFFAQWGIAQ
jgi:NAD dependent epimerase/dehydratase family enzyme